jgi:hypothetical protein
MKRKRQCKFKAKGEGREGGKIVYRGEIVCAKHDCSILPRESGYGFYCPVCRAEREGT